MAGNISNKFTRIPSFWISRFHSVKFDGPHVEALRLRGTGELVAGLLPRVAGWRSWKQRSDLRWQHSAAISVMARHADTVMAAITGERTHVVTACEDDLPLLQTWC